MKTFIISILLVISCLVSFSQSRKTLENKKKQNSKDIGFTNELLKKTKKNKKNTYNKVVLLNSKISIRENLISTIEEELSFINNQILVHQEIIISLENDLKKYRKEYERMIYYSFLNNDDYNNLMFVLASQSFNEAFSRFRYLKEYARNRKLHIYKISDTKQSISEKIVELEIIKADKRNLFMDKKLENQKLLVEKQEYNSLVKTLVNKEKELLRQLRVQEKLAQNLQKEIERIIEEEARKAAELLNKSNKGFYQLTPEEAKLAAIFEKNKSNLPWPTERGVITRKFGEQPHAVLKGVKVNNFGVDIATSENSIVRAVYNGTVTSVFAIPGANKTVMIRHGNYLTVYSNLRDVIVKKGDKVSTKQTIGTIFTNDGTDKNTVLQFQIWLEKKKLDPATWLAKYKNG